MTVSTSFAPIKAAIAAGTIGLLAAMAACSRGGRADGAEAPDVLARVGQHRLTVADLAATMPAGLSEADSVEFAARWIENWVDEQLLTEIAVEQVRNIDEIDRMADDYRRRLIMLEYRRLKVSADTSLAISDADIADYYSTHADEMKLDEPMVRGIYIKIEDDAPALAQVRKWYRSEKQDDIDRLEKVGLKGAIHYDYFRDTWVPLKQIETKIPAEISRASLRKGYTLDFTSGGFTYLLSVSDVLPAGHTMPLEAATPRIRETLDALRSNTLDARLRADLRRRASDNGQLYVRTAASPEGRDE